MALDVFQLLEQVRDRESFLAFARALAAERERAEQLERAEPDRYQLGGALDWQNGSIASFIQAGLEHFSPGSNRCGEINGDAVRLFGNELRPRFTSNIDWYGRNTTS
jgi:hypothetical protein